MIHRIARGCLALTLVLVACTPADSGPDEAPADPGPEATAALPSWTFTPDMVFPVDESLLRAEDGVALTDGRLVVADQAHGVRVVSPDGTHRPFGQFAQAGYQHRPPEQAGGANGVSLEPGGTHILVTDVFTGAIYRVEVATETTTLVYQHEFGVNTARSDRNGGIWFSQSTRNTNEAELWGAVAMGTQDGALFYLPSGGGAGSAVPLVDGLVFANGLALDEAAGVLYVAETMGNRVLRFQMDAAGGLSERTVVLEVNGPDNVEVDDQGRLWVAEPLLSEIVVYDPAAGTTQSVFRISTPESEQAVADITALREAGEPWLQLMGPPLWSPAPGAITGMILSPDQGPVYLTGLGNALIRLDR
jgi:sugar lactone lactonase YvrE